MTFAEPVEDAIIHGAPLTLDQRRVLSLEVFEARHVVRGDVLKQCLRLSAADLDLSHVADIEKAGGRAHGQMFRDDAGVFDGHLPARELHHPAARRLMDGVERRALELDGRSRGQTPLSD